MSMPFADTISCQDRAIQARAEQIATINAARTVALDATRRVHQSIAATEQTALGAWQEIAQHIDPGAGQEISDLPREVSDVLYRITLAVTLTADCAEEARRHALGALSTPSPLFNPVTSATNAAALAEAYATRAAEHANTARRASRDLDDILATDRTAPDRAAAAA